jgi:hypothetical protein
VVGSAHLIGRRRRDGRAGERDGGDDLDRRCSPTAEQGLYERHQTTEVRAAAQALPPRPAGRRLLKPGGEGATGAEDQGLDRGLRHIELVGHLAIREALPLAQQDRPALVLGHLLEHVLEADQLVGDPLLRGDDLLEDLQVVRRLDAAAAP